MNNLRAVNLLRKTFDKAVLLNQTSVRSAYVITEEWLPGPRPKTDEERAKAAKKYNLLPEEYQPLPDDGFAVGDYPDLPQSHHDQRDPFYPWDDPIFRRNFGEPMPENSMNLSYDRVDPDNFVNVRRPMWKQVLAMFGVVGPITLFWYWGTYYPYYQEHFGGVKYEKGKPKYSY